MFLCDKLRTRSLGLASEGVIFMPCIIKVGKMVHSHARKQTHTYPRTYVHARTHAARQFYKLIPVLRKGKEAKGW